MSEGQLEFGQDDNFLALVNAWSRSLEILSKSMNKPSFDSWIKTLKPAYIHEDMAVFSVSSKFAKQIIEQNHLDKIKETISIEYGSELRVNIKVVEESTDSVLQITKTPEIKHRPKDSNSEPLSLPLNSKFSFDSFVVGRTNRMATACAISVAENPGGSYNPLFIYGGSGLGKTHLMHAIGQSIAVNHSDLKFAFISGEAFTNMYIASVREHKTAEFRRSVRAIDIWLFDDIHFLMGKDRTEEEFFHTYNTLYDMGKQVVLTSDRSPKELELDNRLLSRFEAGMLVDIKPPDLETRVAIVQRKAQWENVEIPDDVALYISRIITSNIRRLEGALISLLAHAALMRVPITVSLAEEVLGPYYDESSQPVIDIEFIQKNIARRFDIDVVELSGKSRTHKIVVPRQIAIYLCRELTDNSLPSIGRAFGGRDHSTVIHSCSTVEKKMATDAEFAALMEDISRGFTDEKSLG